MISGFPGGRVVRKPPSNVGDIETWVQAGLGRSPRVRDGNLLQYSCLRNTDRGAWWDCKSMGLQRVKYDRAPQPTHINAYLFAYSSPSQYITGY